MKKNPAKEFSALEDWFEVAKTGTFPQGDLTEEVFDDLVSTFNPASHEPPVTLGHIREDHNDRPAAAWVSGLKRIGSTLYAKLKQVATDFDSLVREGRFKKRSIGIRADEEGRFYLHHLAFLGAATPAVKGLQDVYQGAYSADHFETQKEYDFNLNPKGNPVKEYTEKEIQEIQDKAAEAAKKAADVQFAETLKTATDKAAKDAKAATEAEFAQKAADAQKVAAYSADVEAAIKEFGDKVTPAQVAILRPVLLSADPAKEIEFTEKGADGKDAQVKKTFLAAMKSFVANIVAAPAGEYRGTNDKGAQGDEAVYSEERAEADKIMKADSKLTFGQALIQARAKIKSAKK